MKKWRQYENSDLINDGKELAKKGIFVYDAVVDEGEHYRDYFKICSPVKPVLVDNVPSDIGDLLSDHVVDVDVSIAEYVSVMHTF